MSHLFTAAMKLMYYFLGMLAVLTGAYLWLNDFSFNHIQFSSYLINTLFIALMLCVVVAAGAYGIYSLKRRSTLKDVMTIRQYYEYKSAR